MAWSELFEFISRPCDLEVIGDDLLDGDDFENAIALRKKLLPHLVYSFEGAFGIYFVCEEGIEDLAPGPVVGISVASPEIWFGVDEVDDFRVLGVGEVLFVKGFEAQLGWGHERFRKFGVWSLERRGDRVQRIHSIAQAWEIIHLVILVGSREYGERISYLTCSQARAAIFA